jgi:hypothetical protein
VDSKFEGVRELNVERAVQTKRLAETHNIPVIATGELKKSQRGDKRKPELSDLMETGKYAYKSDIVLLLWNPGEFDPEAEAIDLQAIVVKNKLSEFKGEMNLSFLRACAFISESQENPFSR